jgi:rhodanese-related sulfurtransferase
MTFKKHFALLSIVVLAGLMVSSCNSSSSSDNQENTTDNTPVNTGERVLDKEAFAAGMKKSGAVLVDLRMPGEFDQGHIEGAINIDFFGPEFKYKLLELNKKKKYYLYCKNETRSKMSMQFMQDNDFKEVYMLKGGYEEWNSAEPQ